jgi:hypothetical protein
MGGQGIVFCESYCRRVKASVYSKVTIAEYALDRQVQKIVPWTAGSLCLLGTTGLRVGSVYYACTVCHARRVVRDSLGYVAAKKPRWLL